MFWTLTSVHWPRLSLCLQNNKWAHIRNNNEIRNLDVAARVFSFDRILSTYCMRTVNLLTDSSSEDDEGKKTIQVDGICTFGGMHMEYVT